MEQNETHWIDPQIGYIIEIPDNKTIIINAGTKKGVRINSQIIVYEPGPEVVDSKTHEILGRRDFIKAKLTVSEVEENFAVCHKSEVIKTGGMYNMASIINGTEELVNQPLNVDKDQIKNWSIKEKTIKINDPIKIG